MLRFRVVDRQALIEQPEQPFGKTVTKLFFTCSPRICEWVKFLLPYRAGNRYLWSAGLTNEEEPILL